MGKSSSLSLHGLHDDSLVAMRSPSPARGGGTCSLFPPPHPTTPGLPGPLCIQDTAGPTADMAPPGRGAALPSLPGLPQSPWGKKGHGHAWCLSTSFSRKPLQPSPGGILKVCSSFASGLFLPLSQPPWPSGVTQGPQELQDTRGQKGTGASQRWCASNSVHVSNLHGLDLIHLCTHHLDTVQNFLLVPC